MSIVKKAVIPVAGYGTRFLPFTKAVPKAMLPIVNKPAVQVVIEEAVKSGIEEILLVVGQHKEIIEAHFSKAPELEQVLQRDNKIEFLQSVQYATNMAKISYITQQKQLGTADAVGCAKKFVGNQPFAVMFGDDVMYNSQTPVLKQLINVYEKYEKSVLGVKKVGENVVKYASVEYDKMLDENTYNMTKITEKPKLEDAKSDLAPLGRYVLRPEIFDIIDNLKPSKNGEYQLTDAFLIESQINGVLAYTFEGKRYDMGDVFGSLQANIEYALRDEKLSEKLKDYLKQLNKTL